MPSTAIAQCYLEGTGVPPSRSEGARWLQARRRAWLGRRAGAAERALHATASRRSVRAGELRRRSGRSFRGRARPADPDFESRRSSGRAQRLEAGSAQGQALLGYVLTNGPESMRDFDEAHRCYEQSAAAGCAEGHLGYALSLARQATDDESSAPGRRSSCASAAEAGLPTAIYLLAVLTEQGVGIEAERRQRRRSSIGRQPRRGHRSAQVRWGLALIEGRRVEQDLATGESWLRRAALAGDARGGGAGRRSLRPRAARCRRITPRRPPGIAALPRRATQAPRAPWHRFI